MPIVIMGTNLIGEYYGDQKLTRKMIVNKNIMESAPDIEDNSIRGDQKITKPMRVLIVDDDEQVIDTLSKVLEALDVSIELKTSRTGYRALELLETDVFDMIILDVQLPDIDGGDILRAARVQAINPNSFIIAISGVPSVLDSMLELGADKCLPKPFLLQELNDQIKDLLKL